MQPGQTSSGKSSYNNSSSTSSNAAYSDNVIQNMRRRFELLTVETPELDFATKESLAKSSVSDDALVQTARSSVSLASRQVTVAELMQKSNKEQRSAWEKMSESRRQFLVDAGYRVPEKKKAQWVSWWEYPQHYAAEYIAKGWDVAGLDSLWRNTGGKPAGWLVENVAAPVFGAIGNAGDDFAGRPVRAWWDSQGQNELARWQIGLEATRNEFRKQHGDLTDEQWNYLLWRYTNENLGELTFLGSSNTNVNELGLVSRVFPLTLGPVQLADLAAAIPGLGWLEDTPVLKEALRQTRKVNPYQAPASGVGVDDATFERFTNLANTMQEMEPYKVKSMIDQWNRVDNGYVSPTEQNKVLRENFENDFERFDLALWEAQGKPLEKYLTDVEKLEPNTQEFTDRFTDLSLNVTSKNDYKTGLNRLKADNAKISMGRIVGRALGIQDTPYLGDLISGTVDAVYVIGLDPANLVGPAVKWSRFARFGIRANEIGLAAAADDAIDVVRNADGIGLTAVKAGEKADTQVVQILSDSQSKSRFTFSKDVLEKTPEFINRLEEAGVNLDNGLTLIDEDGMPTQFLLDNWETLVDAAQKTSDDLVRVVMGRTGATPEDVANLVQRRGLIEDAADWADPLVRGIDADEVVGIYNRLEALDHVQMVLRRVGKPTVDIATGNRVFNWFANTSLAGTRRWMDRVVQGFIDLENNVDNAMTSLTDDLGAGATIIIPLKQYHELLKSRGLKGITNRQDLWSWLETSALYHMNIGNITGQIARGFGSGIPLPNSWRVFGRLADDVPKLQDRAALGMLPRLSKNGIRRRRLWNKTESAMFATVATKDNESLLRKVAMMTPRAAAKFTFALSHQIPVNSYLHLAGDNSVAEFEKLLNYGFFAGIPREVLNDFLERFIRGESAGTRVISDLTRTEINQRFDTLANAMIDGAPMVTGSGGEILGPDAYNKVFRAIQNHPVIQQIRIELGIDEAFQYRSGSINSWENNVRPEGVEQAFEYGWSDEVIERWDEVAPILERSSFKTKSQIREDILKDADEFLESLDVNKFATIFTDPTSFDQYVQYLLIASSSFDLGTRQEALLDYVNTMWKHLTNDSDFLLAYRENLEQLRAADFESYTRLSELLNVVADGTANSRWTQWIKNFGDTGLEAIEYENLTDMLTHVFKSYRRESVFNATVASRIKIEQQFLHELFNKAGVYAKEGGRDWADDFFGHLQRFRYAPNDEDVVKLKTLSGQLAEMRVAVLPYSQRSRAVAIPPFEKFLDKMNQIGLTGRFTRTLNRSFLDAAMTQIWKPLTLMRLGFIPRAAGEEYIAFYARRGIWAPLSSVASNIAPDRRGAILGTLNHLGSLPSRFYRRISAEGWHNEFAQVSEVIKFRNQADYMAKVAGANGVNSRRLFSGSDFGGRVFDEITNFVDTGTFNWNNLGLSKLPKETLDKSLRKVNAMIANNFDYLRIASEYHTAKIAASIKSFNFKLMPENLKRAILVEFAGTGKSEFAQDLGLIDHYAVTEALKDDVDKLLRVGYMQQNFADAQSGVGGMIADPNLTDQVSTETIRLKSSKFSKNDDIVVEVRADRGWVSVDPTQLQDDGLYLAAAQQGSLIDNDPIAMEAVRVLANRIQERRLALNYQHLAGTQWDTPLMEVKDVPFGVDDVMTRLVELGADSGRASDFVIRLRDNPIRTLEDVIRRHYVGDYDAERLGLDVNFKYSMEGIEQRALVAAYLEELTPNELKKLKDNISNASIGKDFDTAIYDLEYAKSQGLMPAEQVDEIIGHIKAGTWENNLELSPYFAQFQRTKNRISVYVDVVGRPDRIDETTLVPERLFDPQNPQRRSPYEGQEDILDRHLDNLRNSQKPDRLAADILESPSSAQSLLDRPELADSLAPSSELRMNSVILNEELNPTPSIVDGELQNDEFFANEEVNPFFNNLESSQPATNRSEQLAQAEQFFDENLFRALASYDQMYVDEAGNLHLYANTSGRNAGEVISTIGIDPAKSGQAGYPELNTFLDFWLSQRLPESTSVIAIRKDSVKGISGGAGADNPEFPFEIELRANADGEVIIPLGQWKLYYEKLETSVPSQFDIQDYSSWAINAKIDRMSLVAELEQIARGELDQANSKYFRDVDGSMQYFINRIRVQGTLATPPGPRATQKLNTEKTLEQFELIRQSVGTLETKDRRLLQAAFQADQIAAGKSARDPLVANSIDTNKLHPSIQHQLDYLPEGANYAKALKRAVELSDDGDSTMLEILQIMSSTDRDVAQILFSNSPLQYADEAADIVAAEAAVLRALQDPNHAAVLDDFYLGNVDEATGLGPASGVNAFERPVYSVMVDTWTAQFIERLLAGVEHTAEDMRGIDVILNMLRTKGATDEELELVQRVVLGFDRKQVSRQVAASNRLYRSTLVPISSTVFTNVQDAQRAVDLLTGLSPAAGEYRRYLGFGSRPNTETFAHVGRATVPADKGRILNAVISDDSRTLTFEPNFQYHVDRMSPLAENENLIYYNDVGEVTPAGEIAIEGVAQETILREASRRIVSSVLGFVQSREGRYLHELIGPMDRGTWGVDAMYHVPVSELPSRIIYRTAYVAPQGNWWNSFVQNNFELINKAIFSISRSPQFTLGLSEGLAFAREITETWRDPNLDAIFDDIITEVNDVGEEQLTRTLANNTRRELRNAWAMIGEAANTELNDGSELLDELAGLAGDGRLHPESSLLDLTEEQADSVLEWIRLDAHLEKLEMQRGFQRAVAETVPYIDDNNIRSFFQVYAKNIFPFQFAQEAFLKRWARTVIYSPEAFRRMQLLVHSLQSSGFAHEDPVSGKLVFVFPWTESLEDLIISNPVTQVMFGDAARLPIANPMTGKVENVLPGIPSDFQNLPQASPIAMVPLTALAAKFPEFKPFVSTLSGGRPIDTSGVIPTAETVLSQWVPANYLRMVSAGLGIAAERILDVNITNSAAFGFTDTELSQATMSAMAQLEAESIRLRAELESVTDEKEIAELVDKINLMSLPDNATAVQIEQHADMVMQWARMNMMFRSVVGFASPTAPRNAFEGYELSSEYGALLKIMSPEEALAAFLTEHPNAQPWTIFQTEKTTSAELAPTQRTLNWMDDNRDFLNDYQFASPWFMPQSKDSDEGSMQAHIDMVAAGLKQYKLPIVWYRDLKSASAANIYFPSKARKDAALENTVESEQRKKIENEWTLWSDEFKKQHPIFAEELAAGIDSKAQTTLNELNDLLVLGDDELPETEHLQEMRVMVQSWKRYEASMNRIKGLSSKEVRTQRENLRVNFLTWGEMFVVDYPKVRSLWNSLILPAADLTSEARLLQGKDN